MKLYILIISLLLTLSIYAQDGLIKSYYDDGYLESQVFYIKDVIDGTAKWYYKNGVVKEERTYSMGVLNGWIRANYDNGAKKLEIPVNFGIKDGIAREYYNNGGLKTLLVFDKGVLKERKEFKYDSTLKPPRIVYKKKKTSEDELPKGVDSTFLAQIDKQFTKEEPQTKSESLKSKSEESKTSEEIQLPGEKNAQVNMDGIVYYVNVDIPPEPIGGNTLLQKKAVYPKAAGKADIKGEVIILAKIDEYGKVLEAKVGKGLGYGCDESAQKAVMSTLFRPGKSGKDYVKVLLRIPFKFQPD